MPAGRHRKEIESGLIDKHIIIGTELVDIAFYFDVSPDTIERRIVEWYGINFAAYSKQIRNNQIIEDKITVHEKLMEGVRKGNTAMIIFLAKNLLGMTDKPRMEISGGTVKIEFVDQ